MARDRGRRNDPVYNEIYKRFGSPRNKVADRQVQIERMYERVLMELCMNRYRWTGGQIPGAVDISTRWLELNLLETGLAVIAQDRGIRTNGTPDTDMILAFQAAPDGRLNIVGDPVRYTLYGPNFQSARLSILRCVPVWANYLRMPDIDIVQVYAKKLANIDRTIEINSMNARKSKILAFTESQALTVQNINRMVEDGAAAIPVNFALGDAITSLDLGVDPKTIELLSIVRARLWNECMGLLGINNSNQDKKERLVQAEVGANDDQVMSVRRVNLNARQHACEQINEMFGLDLWVDFYRSEAPSILELPTEEM